VTPRVDVAIVGLGAAGSAAALTLARRGRRVIGLDRFHPPHSFGSSHGRSRIIREAYYESPAYVPLVRRAFELWRALERDAGRALLTQTGGLMLGPAAGVLVDGARRSAELYELPHELLDAAEVRRRFPAFRPAADMVGMLEHRAGFLDPETCIASCLELAAGAGAELWFDTAAAGWERTGEGIRLDTARGLVECDRLILAAGAWIGDFVEGGVLPVTVTRQVMYWFRPGQAAHHFRASQMPVFIWEWQPDRMIYGFPDHGAGFKVARHHEGPQVSAAGADRVVGAGEIAEMREILQECFPEVEGPPTETATCLYTSTPDHHFVLGPHPHEPRVILASPCSGHGFKFASAIGEVLADLATTGISAFDLTPFSPRRFTAT
jgi:sarcosine oxidase